MMIFFLNETVIIGKICVVFHRQTLSMRLVSAVLPIGMCFEISIFLDFIIICIVRERRGEREREREREKELEIEREREGEG